MGEGASGESSEEKPAVFLFSPSPLSHRFRVLPRSRQCIYEPKTRTRQKKKNHHLRMTRNRKHIRSVLLHRRNTRNIGWCTSLTPVEIPRFQKDSNENFPVYPSLNTRFSVCISVSRERVITNKICYIINHEYKQQHSQIGLVQISPLTGECNRIVRVVSN